MRYSTSNNKIMGIFGIMIGLVCFISLFITDKSKLIIPISSIFFVKYFLFIVIINCGLLFTVGGILMYKGFFKSYYSNGITKYEKAKNQLFGIVFLIPFWISFSTTIFVISDSILLKILWGLALIYITWLLCLSVQTLKKGRTETG